MTEITNIKNKIPLYGLVLAGGKSSRMKTDKSKLVYHGKTQEEYCFELLSEYCEKVFVSYADKNSNTNNFPVIYDSVIDIGATGGILSALTEYPNTAFLVLACDMPYVDKKTIETLILGRNILKDASSYINNENNLPEPLCAIYEPKIKERLIDFISKSSYCPRKILINSDLERLKPNNDLEMCNINYPQEYENIIKKAGV